MRVPSTSAWQRRLLQSSVLLALAFVASDRPAARASHDAPPAVASTIGTSYEWISAESPGAAALTIARPQDYILRIQPDGSVGVRADCNWRAAAYNAAAGRLALGPALGSPTTCSGPSMGGLLMEWLATTTAIDVQDDGLLSIALQDGGRLLFRPLQPQV